MNVYPVELSAVTDAQLFSRGWQKKTLIFRCIDHEFMCKDPEFDFLEVFEDVMKPAWSVKSETKQ